MAQSQAGLQTSLVVQYGMKLGFIRFFVLPRLPSSFFVVAAVSVVDDGSGSLVSASANIQDIISPLKTDLILLTDNSRSMRILVHKKFFKYQCDVSNEQQKTNVSFVTWSRMRSISGTTKRYWWQRWLSCLVLYNLDKNGGFKRMIKSLGISRNHFSATSIEWTKKRLYYIISFEFVCLNWGTETSPI